MRYFAHDHSVFIDNDYLIKGVAGCILWTLLKEHAASARRDFCNRELRRDPRLPLPDFADNLETRPILLQRRLAERCPSSRSPKPGAGASGWNWGGRWCCTRRSGSRAVPTGYRCGLHALYFAPLTVET